MEIQINMLKKGERFKIHIEDMKIYVRGDYVFKDNKYICSLIDKPEIKELFAGKKKVFKMCTYSSENSN